MSVYDKRRRPSIADPSRTTAPTVGPGSYGAAGGVAATAAGGATRRQEGGAEVPFLSTSARDTHTNLHNTNVAAPGPGHYDVAVEPPVRGGYTSRLERFAGPAAAAAVKQPTPGPGHYDPEGRRTPPSLNGGSAARRRRHDTLSPDGPRRPRLLLVRQPSAPSVPSARDAFGFAENAAGFLVKQQGPVATTAGGGSHVVGPTHYDVDKGACRTTTAYKGVHWSKMTSGRNLTTDPSEARASGRRRATSSRGSLYSALADAAADVEREQRKAKSALPRYHVRVRPLLGGAAASSVAIASAGAGGDCNDNGFVATVRSPPTRQPCVSNVELISRAKTAVERPPFGSSAGTGRTDLPSGGGDFAAGVATATAARPSAPPANRPPGTEAPFGQTQGRFRSPSDGVPGPGWYNVADMATESLRRAYAQSTRKGVFGTTGARLEPLSRDAVQLPGPAHYRVGSAAGEAGPWSAGSAVFLSTASRFADGGNGSDRVAAEPEPDAGIAGVSPDSTQTSQRQAGGWRAIGGGWRVRGTSTFRSTASRFAPPRDLGKRLVEPHNPGPGDYSPQWRTPGRHDGALVTHSQRFADAVDDGQPGPAHYTYPPLLRDTVLQGSFNVNIAAQR